MFRTNIKTVWSLILIIVVIICQYSIITKYTPQTFDRSLLVDKKFRCIRYFHDTNDYNKHMEKTCEMFKIDYMFFNSQKAIYENILMITAFFGIVLII